MDLALCISLKPKEAAGFDREAFAELDGEEVLNALVQALSLLGNVRVWDTIALGPADILAQSKPDIIFNVAEGITGMGREAQAPALFEWLQWPYVGSDPVTLAITLDKWYTKSVLKAADIPTPRAVVVQHPIAHVPRGLKYPVIVKPVAEGSGKGVLSANILESEQGLVSLVNTTMQEYRQPVLVEEFMSGREFTVALMGNVSKWEALPIVEIDFKAFGASKYPIFGYDAKWGSPTMDDTICPASIPDDLRRMIESIAMTTCDALRIRDWARVDIRLAEDGTPNVLEVNAVPGILPGISDISCFTRAAFASGLDYNGMIHKLVRTAMDRYSAM